MRPAKIVAIVIGALLIIIGLGLLVPGIILLSVNGAYKDANGYLTTGDRALTSNGYALTTPDARVNIGSGDWIPGGGKVQLQATSRGSAPVFIGIAPTSQVNSYLSGVAYDEVTNLGVFSSSVRYRHQNGGAPPTPPGQQTFWTAKQEGTGQQTLQWTIESGQWTAVIMNGDASTPVDVDVRVGARLGFLLPLGIGMTIAGVVLLAVGIVLVVLGARRPRQPVQPGYPGGPGYVPPAPYPPGSYPPGTYPQQSGAYPQQPGGYPPDAYRQPPPPYEQPRQDVPPTAPAPVPPPPVTPPPESRVAPAPEPAPTAPEDEAVPPPPPEEPAR